MATAEIIAKAKEKIAKQIDEYEDLKRESGVSVIMPTDERNPFKEVLFNRIDTVDGFAEKVLQECKSIEKGLIWSAEKIPERVKELKMVHLSTEDVFKLFCEYFDWDEEREKLIQEAEQRKREAERKAREEERKKKKKDEKQKAKADAAPSSKKSDSAPKEERQMDIFGLCGASEPKAAEEEKPQEAPSAPITLVRPIEQPKEEEDIVVDIDDDPRLPFDQGLPLASTEDPMPQSEEEAVTEEVTEEAPFSLLGF